MSIPFYVSYGALWLLFVVQAVLLFLIYRHIGLTLLSTSEGIQRDGLGVGEIAPPVSGITAEGGDGRWLPQPGRSEILVFAAADCEPCTEVFPLINQVAAGASGRGVPVTAIVSGDRGQAIRACEKFGSVVPILAEDGSGAFGQYRVRVTPFAFVIGADGRVQAKGLCSNSTALTHLLATGGLNEVARAVEPGIQIVRPDPSTAFASTEVRS